MHVMNDYFTFLHITMLLHSFRMAYTGEKLGICGHSDVCVRIVSGAAEMLPPVQWR